MTPAFFRIRGDWAAADHRAALRCRLGLLNGSSRVPAGLYALGNPGAESPVLLAVSYRISFDLLRRHCAGRDAWIVVADTGTLDPGAARAAGRLGTAEVAQALASSRVAELVTRRELVLPWEVAADIDTARLATHACFRAVKGPRRTRDLPHFLDSGLRLDPSMEEPTFTAGERLAVVPTIFARSLKPFPAFAFAALIYAGLGPEGVSVTRALSGGWQLLLLGFVSLVCGSVLAPLVPPAAPRPPYSVRGWVLGIAATAVLVLGTPISAGWSPWLVAAALLFFPGAAALLAARACSLSPVAGPADVRRERRIVLVGGAVLSVACAACLVLGKLGAAQVPALPK